MNDVDQSVVDSDLEQRPSRWKRILNWIGWLLIVLMALRFGWLLVPNGSRGGIEVRPDTTHVTEPATPDGFVDFAGAINRRAGDGVTPENNAVVKLIEAFGPTLIDEPHRDRYFTLLGIPPPPEQGDYLIEDDPFLEIAFPSVSHKESRELLEQLREDMGRATNIQWTENDYPTVAEYLRANDEPLRLIVEATGRTRYYSPIPEPDAYLIGVLLPVEQQTRWAARLLLLRGMKRLGEGDAAGAWDDALACHRLARLTGQSPQTIGVLVAYAIDTMACAADAALIRSDSLTAEQARQCLSDLDALPPIASAADTTDFAERLQILDIYCRMASGQLPDENDEAGSTFAMSLSGLAVDWNLMLRLANEHIDRGVEIMRVDDPYERRAEFDRFERVLDSERVTVGDGVNAIIGLRGPMSRNLHALMMSLHGGAYPQIRVAEMRITAHLQLIRLGLALRIHQLENGAYPATLAELAPGVLPEIPLDPCSGSEFIYQPSEGGFLLYSLGMNLTDDEARGHDDDPRGDDIVLRVGVE